MEYQFNMGALKELIRKKGYKLGDMARMIGITAGTFSQKLSGIYEFKQGEIRKICEILNIPNEQIGFYFFTPMFRISEV